MRARATLVALAALLVATPQAYAQGAATPTATWYIPTYSYDILVWDEASLTEYLAAPRTKVPGTKMAFAGIKKPEELTNLVAYLETLPE